MTDTWKPLGEDPEALRELLDAERIDKLSHEANGNGNGQAPKFPAAAASLSEPWSELKAPTLSPFPLDALPARAGLFAEAVSVATQTPLDMAGMVALGAMSAAALGAGTIDCGGWEEELALYLMIALPSGERKSAVLREVCQPLHRIERDWREQMSTVLREQRARKKVLEIRCAKLAKRAGEAEDMAERAEHLLEVEQIEQELEELGEPAAPRLLADDATPEVLASLLAHHHHLAIFAAEAAFVDNLIGRYSDKGSPNLHLVCHAYSAEPTRVDRRNREEWLEAPLVTITLVIQPHVLRSLIEHQVARAQGLVGRFAFVLPESGLGRREINPPTVPGQLREHWDALIRRLFSFYHPLSPKTLTEPTEPAFVGSVSKPLETNLSLSLSPTSQILLSELRAELEPRHLEGRDLRPIADWTARHPGRVARVAALLHLAEHDPGEPVGEETMRRALRIGDYLLEHALSALTTPDELMRKALRWLADHGQETVTQRDLHRGPLNGRGPAERAGELADALMRMDALRAVYTEPPTTGRPPSPAYAINPHLRQAGHSSARTSSR